MKIHDQHVHSYYSYDCDQAIEDYLISATKRELSYFVLTDHCDLNHISSGEDLFFDLRKQDQELTELQNKYPNIKILRGIEIGYRPSELSRIQKIIKDNHFDIINLSLHELDDIDYYFKDGFVRDGVKNTLETYFQKQLEMVNNFDNFDVLSHIDFGFKTAYLLDNSLCIKDYEDTIKRMMQTIIQKDKAFELNVKVQEYLPIEHTKYLLNLYKSLGGNYITISSDAHKIDRFCDGFDKYIPIIKAAGFDSLTYFIDRKKYQYNI